MSKSLRHLKLDKGVTRLPASKVRDLMQVGPRKASKYKAKSVEHDGHFFASLAECDHYLQLKLLLRAGEITDLVLQPRFLLEVNTLKVCEYRGDFQFLDRDGVLHVQDKKGVRTQAYKIKARLMLAIHGIAIEVV